MIEGSIIKHVN